MARFRVSGQVTISVSVVVEADTEEQARALAEQAPVMGLCHQCSETARAADDGEWRTNGELDGEPEVTEVEEA